MIEPHSGGTAAIKSPPQLKAPERAVARASWLQFAVLAAMLATIFALFQYPLRRISSDSEINFVEGWNAYRQQFAREGAPLYGAPPDLLTGNTNYPPLSFHLVNLLSFHGDLVRTGRWISLFSLLATGLLVGLIVRELGADSLIAAFATLLYILGISVFLPDRIGMDDPQLLAETFTTAGLYLYVRARNRSAPGPPAVWASAVPWLLCASALAFCVAGFTKHNLLAFPAAVALDLLLRSRRQFMIWCAAMIAFAAILLGLTFAIDGRYFFQHLVSHRAFSWDNALTSITRFYLATFQGVMLVAMVWSLCRFRARPLLVAAFVFANGLACLLVGGDGVDLNIFFNGLAAAIIVCGAVLAELESVSIIPADALSSGAPPALGAPPFSALFAERVGTSRTSGLRTTGAPSFSPSFGERVGVGMGKTAAVALMLALFLGTALRVPERLREGHLRGELMADDDAGFRAAADLLRATPGPALCESLLLCYRAGKPYTFDTYTAIEEIKSHHTDQDASLPVLRSRHFSVIQLDAIPGEAMSQPATIFRNRSRFTPAFVDTLMENYRLALRTSHFLIFLPK